MPGNKKTERLLWKNRSFFVFGLFVPVNLHALLNFAFKFKKTGVNKPSDDSSERIESLAMPVKKSGRSSFMKIGEKRWNAIK